MDTRNLDIDLLIPDSASCERCLDRLETSLLAVRGITAAQIDRQRLQLRLTIDPDVAGLEVVERGARDVGVELARQFGHCQMTLSGLDCMDCAEKIERGVGRLEGVVWCTVSFAMSQMRVEFETARTGPPAIEARVRELGYDVVTEGHPGAEIESMRRRLTALSGALLAAGMALPSSSDLSVACFALSALAGGGLVVRNGLAALRLGAVDTNLLMGLAALGAAVLGHWEESAMVVFLYSLGNVLEGLALARNRRALQELVELAPRRAIRVEAGGDVSVDVRELRVGDTVRLRPFDRAPVDLRVLRGAGSVDQSTLTGEAAPVPKGPGDELLSGSLNGESMLEAAVVRPHGRDTLSQVLELVRVAQSRKAPSQTFSERFGRIYTPLVLAAAAALALGGALLAVDPADWVRRALTLLVVACPCALVIATPVAIVSALSRAARLGILVKGGAHLEALARCRVFAFDKTGTLTTGRLTVSELVAFPPAAEEETLATAARVAAGSDHPVSRAIVARARAAGLSGQAAESVIASQGAGLEAVVDGQICLLGRLRFLTQRGITLEGIEGEVERLETAGRAISGVTRDGKLLGLLALGDEPRPGTAEAVRRLRQLGIGRLVMLTGDTARTAAAVAGAVGVDETRADLLPADKAKAVEELAALHGPVAMVGDGVNDAPALAQAAVGIAIGAAGNAVAIETADIVLMGGDPRGLPELLFLCQRAGRVIRQNIWFSLGVVAVMTGMALTGTLPLAAAVAAHEGSALLVIANGLRLLGRSCP